MYEINTRVDGMYTVVLSTLLVESTQVGGIQAVLVLRHDIL